ncbi:MAG: PEP-CTERM sorting domain-containing protein [Armatimonadetes bacterium]|nr:PEP-CTERM sorting domain-containing protein [Armatimonadota bacterium]
MKTALVLACLCGFVLATSAFSAPFNGVGDNQTDLYGNYYTITGGKFPTGTTPNGDNASGGTFRFILDDSAWGSYSLDTWHKDDWFTSNAGLALTLQNGASTVYDNNGIEDGTYGDYYDANGSHGLQGLYRGFSMSNNWDWIYAGYFKLTEATTFDKMIGYFDDNGGSTDAYPFLPGSPNIKYRMNIWSNVTNDLLPTNTGSFDGDVFCSDNVAGAFSWSFTGVNRIMPDNSTDPIDRLVLSLQAPVTLQPGEYWFSHDASIVPEPGSIVALLSGLIGLGVVRRRK